MDPRGPPDTGSPSERRKGGGGGPGGAGGGRAPPGWARAPRADRLRGSARPARHRKPERAQEGGEGGAERNRAAPHPLRLQMNEDQPRLRAVWHADIHPLDLVGRRLPPAFGERSFIDHAGRDNEAEAPAAAPPDSDVAAGLRVRKAGLAEAAVQEGKIVRARRVAREGG